MADQHSAQSTRQSQANTARVLLELLRDIDPSARVDLNTARPGEMSYEVRMYGAHVGFVYITPDGALKEYT